MMAEARGRGQESVGISYTFPFLTTPIPPSYDFYFDVSGQSK